MTNVLKSKHLLTIFLFVIESKPIFAHEIKFIKSIESTQQAQELIKSTLEKSCRSIYNSPLRLTEVLSRNYCNYENKWCWNNGFSVLDMQDGQTLVVQYAEDMGKFKITAVLSNSNLIVCDP